MSLQGDRHFEWDDDKHRSNIAKHRLDFIDDRAIFDGRPTVDVESVRDDEARVVTTGQLDDRLITVVWTRRGDTIRLISAKGARDDEKRAYRAVHGG